MPQAKKLHPKKKTKPVTKTKPPVEDNEEEVSVPVSKIKKVVEVDIQEDVGIIVEEKPEVDPLLGDEEADELSSEESLDEEEINPFGDKWEV